MNRYLLIFVLLFLPIYILAQESNYTSGAKSKALSDASVAITDHWACFNNQAGLAFIKKSAIGVYVENKFNIPQLNSGTLAAAIKTGKNGTLGLSLYSLNNSTIYSRQKLGLAYALKIAPHLSCGIQMNLIRTHFEQYNSSLALCGELGLLYNLNEHFNLGVHIFNPTSSYYYKDGDQRIPTFMRVGGSYSFAEKAILSVEIENNVGNGYSFKTGLEYILIPQLSLYAGVRTAPVINSFGIAYSLKNFNFLVSFQFFQTLGATPGLSFNYDFDN